MAIGNMATVNITEDGLEKKLKRTALRATATMSGKQVRALLALACGVERPQMSQLVRVREMSGYARVTLSREEMQLLLTLALEVKRQSA
jgi:hypothetical protein